MPYLKIVFVVGSISNLKDLLKVLFKQIKSNIYTYLKIIIFF